MPDLDLEKQGQAEFVCDCCGGTTHRVWGWVHEGDATRCVYFVQWAAQGGPHPPHITLGYGSWGEETSADDRVSIYAELEAEGIAFVDHPAPGASETEQTVLGGPLRARDVKADPRAAELTETVEFVLRSDDRLKLPTVG
jgi:hypothetical protein